MNGGRLLAEKSKVCGLAMQCCAVLQCNVFLLGCLHPSPRLEITATMVKDSMHPPAAGDTECIDLVPTMCGKGNCFVCIASTHWLFLNF